MRDEIYDQDFQAARAGLNDGIDHLIGATAHAFRRLAAIQFAAPWRKDVDRPAPPVTAARHRALLLIGVTLASGASIAAALVPFGVA